MYRGHVHRFIFLFICVHTDVRFEIHYFVLWPCDMAIFVQHYCYIHIYNIKEGSNLYMLRMVDLILEHDIMVDLVLEHDMCG